MIEFIWFLIFLKDILDPEKGHIKDDAIILEVWVSADAPHGVRSVHSLSLSYLKLKSLSIDSSKIFLIINIKVLIFVE